MNIEITKREILVSVVIAILFVCLGIFIYGKITDHLLSESERYNTALKVKDKDTFDYVIDTQQGNIIVEANIKAKDTVSFPELKKDYLYISKNKEEYTRHEETYTDSKGKTHTRVYWSWDWMGNEARKSNKLEMFDKTYKTSQFTLFGPSSLDASAILNKTAKKSNWRTNHYYYVDGDTRYYYTAIPVSFDASFIAKANDKGLSPIDGSTIYLKNTDIKGMLEGVENSGTFTKVVFWVVWLMLTVGIVVIYISLENRYLEG